MKKTETPTTTPEGWKPWVSRSQLDEFIPFHPDHIDDMVEQGRFPAPIPVGPKKRMWLLSELIEWQQALIRARKPRKAA